MSGIRKREVIRRCPCGCGKNEYDLGVYNGFHLYQKPFFNGWYVYAEKLHPDELDSLILNSMSTISGKLWDDTERLAKPSEMEMEKNVISSIDEFWIKKGRIIHQILLSKGAE